MTDVAELAGSPVFDGLDSREMAAVMGCGCEEGYESGEAVIEESSVSSDLYILLEGRASVEIEVTGFGGRRREQLVILRKGDIFGEVTFLKGKRRSAFVVAYDNIRVFRLDSAEMYRLFDVQSRIGYVIMKNLAAVLAQRLRDTNFRWRKDSLE